MAAAAADASRNIKKTSRNSDIFVPLRSENYMLLSTTYPLNNSDTKRIHVGLRAVNEDTTFEVALKLTGNSSSGIYFDPDTWQKFQGNLELAGNYLRENVRELPEPVFINNIVINFTTAYGARAIMVANRQKSPENGVSERTSDSGTPPAKKRRTYTVAIVMQKSSFEGLENIVKCINARYNQLNAIVNQVNDCARFLLSEIELNLPKRSLDEDIIKQTLDIKYQEIQQNVLRQLKDLNFLDSYFEILFQELTSLHLYEIVRTIIINSTS